MVSLYVAVEYQIGWHVMKQRYLKYYSKPTPWASFWFSLAMLLPNVPLRKASLSNRNKDYLKLLQSNELWDLHRRINEILLEQTKNYDAYDYGEGYFYQSLEEIGISGFRQTQSRVEALDLGNRLQDRNVLDVGCNAGFILLSVSDKLKRGFGFDINPYLIQIGNLVAEHLSVENLTFAAVAFEELDIEEKFDTVLSLANHSTYDQNTKQTIDSYFGRCRDLLCDGGQLIFESHPPELESADKLSKTIDAISTYFEIDETKTYEFSSFLDKNRTYVFATRK
jgi:SAM-dependent methyltransferase